MLLPQNTSVFKQSENSGFPKCFLSNTTALQLKRIDPAIPRFVMEVISFSELERMKFDPVILEELRSSFECSYSATLRRNYPFSLVGPILYHLRHL